METEKKKELTQQQLKLNTGLHHILDGLPILDDINAKKGCRLALYSHPFGLEMGWSSEDLVHKPPMGLLFLGESGVTDFSVQIMISHLRWFVLRSAFFDDARPSYLRVISVEVDPLKHPHVFFEVGCKAGVFICGGSEGPDTTAMGTLQGIFALLSTVYGVEITEIAIPPQKAGTMAQDLERKVHEWYKS